MNVTQVLFGASRNQRGRVLAICVVTLLSIATIDYFTGTEARVYPLYYLPIALSAWRVSTRIGVLFAVLSTVLWMLAMSMAGPKWSVGIYALNTATQGISFVLVSLLVSNIATRLALKNELSQTDPLTGLKNTRAFTDLGGFTVSSAQRTGRPITLAYLDLDNFKGLNDRFGHEVGDQALKWIGKVLLEQTRKSDVVARLGGDEFVILLPDTSEEAAKALLERIVNAIATEMAAQEWPTTASIGAHVFLTPPETLSIAIQKADAVMYRAKNAGRNRVLIEVGSEQ